MPNIGETTALIPQAGTSTEPDQLLDGGSGDIDFPHGDFKALATVGEKDPVTDEALTGYPDGQAAWLLDEDTVRVAYQSESYATLSASEGETYGWVMDSGAVFTGSHVHTIDYDRQGFADFLNNDEPASEIFEGSGKLFSTVYNVFGEEVTGKNLDPTDLGAKWGNQTLADGTVIEFDSDQLLTQGDWFFHSFCGAYYEQANKYGDGIGFEDDMWLMAEEWNIGQLFEEAAAEAGITEENARLSPGADFFTTTMGLASMVVDIENETAYTVPVLGQSGYEKLLPMNSGHEDYVVLVMAGYNLEIEPAPLTVYVGKKGVDEDGNALTEDASERDSFLGRNGLLYGQLYGMALDDQTYADLGIDVVDADTFMMDDYAKDADAPDNFSAKYIPTSYQWDGFDTPEAAADTEMFLWEQDGDTLEDGTVEANEQPDGYTYFNGDSKTEHPAVDPDITKHRYVQNLTVPSAQLGIEFTDIVNELENNDLDGNGLPDYLSADVTRILAGVDGSLTLETGGKGLGHQSDDLNPDGTLTHAIHIEDGEARMDQPDGLQWVKAADGDFLIVDEDSGNDAGERKYVLPIDGETLELVEEGTGYFLASAGGSDNPRALEGVAAIPGTFTRATSSEFSGSWNVTHLVETKEDGTFYTQEEIAGTGAQEIIGSVPLAEQTFIGVVQHRGESSGIIEERQADQGGQIFQFNIDLDEQSKLVDGKTSADPYVFNLPDVDTTTGEDPEYDIVPLLTVGDEVPLLEGDFGSFTTSDTQTYAFAGIPDGIGHVEIDGLNYVWVNHELRDTVTTDVSSTIEGQINGARVSLLVFDENWDVIGGKNLIERVDIDGVIYSLNLETGNYEDPDGNVLNLTSHDNFSRFCSAYLAAVGFEGGPIYFAPEETGNGLAIAIGPDGTATPILGAGVYAKEQVYAASEYRADNSDQTVILLMEDTGNGEIYMYVGEQTADDPNGFQDTTNSLYVLRVEDQDGNVFAYEDMPENESLVAKWVAVPDDITLNPDGSVLSDWVDDVGGDGVVRSTNFRRPEDMHEDPNNAGVFYLVTTGRTEKNGSLTERADTPEEADNPYGKLHRLILNADDPTADGTFEFLMEGGPETGVSFDNMTVDSDGNVLIQEDRTGFGSDVLREQESHGRVLSYNIAANEGVVGEDKVTFLFENNTAALDPTQAENYGDWESSGIVEVGDTGSYLLDVQAHSIRDNQEPDGSYVGRNDDGDGDEIFYEGRYTQGGQLILAVPTDPAPVTKLVGFSSLPADTFEPGLPGGSGNSIDSDNRNTPFDEQPVQGFSGVQFAGDGNYWFLSDNGYGSKDNSDDYLLRIFKVDPNFQTADGGTGEAEVLDFIQLSDPNDFIDFDIVQEGTSERLLTGADFDIESFVVTDDRIWVGEEFGPYLLEFSLDGELLSAPIATPNFVEFDTLNGQTPLVIGHRGASGERPEHTLEAYELAIEQGADFIEPDLVATKDGVLIARHENALAEVQLDDDGNIVLDDSDNPIITSETTNVATFDKFSDRLTVKSIDGSLIGGWFSEDFTLAEIKELKARELIPNTRPDNTDFNDQFEIPTLAEIIQLVKDVEAETGQKIGIYPETKHPTYFEEEGTLIDGSPIDINLGATLTATLVAEGFTDPDRIFIQSFEVANLIELENEILPFFSNFFGPEIVDIPLVQLFGDTDDAFINEAGGGFSVPYDIVYNFSQEDFDAAAALETYGGLVDLVPDFGEDVNGDDIPDTTYQDLASAEVFDYIGETYAEGVGPWKNSFLLRESIDEPVDGDGDGNAEITSQLTGEVRPYVEWAHDAGMQIHPYTHRDDERFLTLNPDGTPQTPEEEIEQLIELGVDGFFTDFPETGAMVRDQLAATEVLSPDNPAVLEGDAEANLSRSRGYEGLGYSPDRMTLYPLLEGSVVGDPDNALRIYEFDVESGSFADELAGYYELDDPNHAIGDMTPINDNEFIIIERDGGQGETALFKKLFKVDLSQVDENGFVEKTELVDLLNIADPDDLNNDGSLSFEFPFVTIEDVIVLDEKTLLVANDNNYPFSMGREGDIDNNEIIKIELNESLNLDPRLGESPTFREVGLSVDKTSVTEDGDTYTLTLTLDQAAPEGGLRVVWSQTDSDNALGDIEFPPTLTNASNLEQLTPEGEELARSAITIDEGATTATITFTTVADMVTEGDETNTYTLIDQTGYSLSDGSSVTVTIEDTSIPTELPTILFGTPGDDDFDTERPGDTGFIGDNQILFAGSGNDFVDVSSAPGGPRSRLDLGSGDDILFAGSNNRILAGAGDDTLFLGSGEGDNIVTGGSGMDQFWIVTDQEELPTNANVITDFTIGEDVIGLGFGITDLTFDDLTLTQNGADTTINGLGQDLAILRGIQTTDLSASDFVIV